MGAIILVGARECDVNLRKKREACKFSAGRLEDKDQDSNSINMYIFLMVLKIIFFSKYYIISVLALTTESMFVVNCKF